MVPYGKEGKTRFYVIQCRFSEFLIQLCIKTHVFLVPAEILLLCAEKLPLLESVQKYSYPGIRCPWILVQRAILGVCAEILIFGEIFTSGLCSQVPFMFSEL